MQKVIEILYNCIMNILHLPQDASSKAGLCMAAQDVS